jgi:hypothetical protein
MLYFRLCLPAARARAAFGRRDDIGDGVELVLQLLVFFLQIGDFGL